MTAFIAAYCFVVLIRDIFNSGSLNKCVSIENQ